MQVDPKELRPLNGMIVVRDIKRDEKVGHIYLAENVAQDRMILGVVLSVSCFMLQDGKYIEAEVKPGDKIFYSMHAGAGNAWEYEKETYRVIRHNEMLAVVQK